MSTISDQERRALAEKLLRARAATPPSPAPPSLSHGQRMMWFLHALQPDSGAYNIGQAVRLRGRLDIAALRAAVDDLVHRHEALRTVFPLRDGTPMPVDVATAAVDFAAVHRPMDDARLDAALTEELEKPFDLERGPLVRFRLYAHSPDDHVLVLGMHHIVGEFWSLVILVRDLGELYAARREGRPPNLAPLPARYRDFVAHEHRVLGGDEGARHWAYWSERLTGELPIMDLPADRPRPAHPTHAGAHAPIDLGPELSARLTAFARAEGLTSYAVLLAAFGLQLARYCGMSDLVVGTPFSRRSSAAWENVVGYFDNPLPIRLTLGEGVTFTALARQVRSRVAEAFEHADLPLAVIVDRLGLARDASRPPLFNTMLVFRRAQANARALTDFSMGAGDTAIPFTGDLDMTLRAVERRVSALDLSLVLAESEGRIGGYFEYSTALFDRSTVERFAGHFRQLLSGALDCADAPVRTLHLITDAERRRALATWNDTARDLGVPGHLHAPFYTTVGRTPDAPAMVAAGDRWSYARLADAVDRVARRLQELGTAPGKLVAVVMDKGWEQIVAVLAILRAGGAYMPVDAKQPQERIARLLTQGRVEVALVQPGTTELPVATHPLLVDRQIASWPAGAGPCAARPDDLAYVIFTSGSTGVPKGVMIEHRAALNTVRDVNDRFDVSPADRTLLLSSLSFDLSVYDVFGIFAAGGTLIVPDADRAQDPAHWVDLAREHAVTIWNSVPSLAELAISEAEHRATKPLRSLRLVLMSGDWIPLSLPSRVALECPAARQISLGGATEASIWSILHSIEGVRPEWRSIPYGRPMANQAMYVLDGERAPCPVGVVGEIYIGGDGVARGYWDDPERTATSFVEDAHIGRRLYRTGDLGRYMPDGELELLGRKDNQVKIRGFRVELGEIEAALATAPYVERAVVTARADGGVAQRLVAYVVSRASSPSIGDLRAHLEQRLPEYMRPAAYVLLDALPLGSNGKIDVARLPAPSSSRPNLTTRYRAPSTDAESALLDVWSAVLALEEIGIDDDFFELGGDSIVAIRASVAARQRGIAFSPRELFEHPTVARLSRVSRDVAPDLDDSLPPREGAMALSPMQKTMLLHSALERSPSLYAQRIVCELHGDVNPVAFERAVASLADHHTILRARFTLHPQLAQIVDEHLRVPVRIVDARGLEASERADALERVLAEERGAGFDLETGPLMRVLLVRMSEVLAHVVLSHHHILFDGWSLSPLLRDLLALHDGEDVRPGSVSFFDHTERLTRDDSASSTAYWRATLTDLPRPTTLLGEPPVAPGTAFVLGCAELAFAADETEALTRFARRHGLTLSTVLLGAWSLILAMYDGVTDVTCGVTFSGRPAHRPEMNEVVGLFINTVPVRSSVDASATLADWLKELQQRQARASDHIGLTAGELERIAGASGRDQFALYESVFVFENYAVDDQLHAYDRRLRIGAIRFEEETGTPVTLYAFPGKRLRVELAYDEARLPRHVVDGVLRTLQALTRRMALSAGTERLDDVLPHAEDAVRALPPALGTGCILATLREHVRLSPNAVAVRAGDECLTYAQLDVRARELAAFFRSQGVATGDLVGLSVRRSAEMIVALLGILYAGAGYVPLEGDWPALRAASALRGAGAAVVVTDHPEQFQGWRALPTRAPARTRALDELPPSLTPDHPAYAICTSGSTGEPKAVVITHRALDTFVASARETYGLRSTDRMLQFSSVAFDASVEEIFVTLGAGAELVLRPPGEIPSPREFWSLCSTFGITVVGVSTAYFHALATELDYGGPPASVRLVIIGGEAARRDEVVAFVAAAPDLVLLNTYGPTEATVVATVADLRVWALAGGDGRPPIGSPLRHVEAFVLGPTLRPVADGVPGQLALAGASLATGYANDPSRTERAFRRVTIHGRDVRVYLTGDRVRRRPDGALDFLGRSDDQVKVRGYRVETGDVEAHIVSHPDVSRVAVVAADASAGSRRLVAFVVPRCPASGRQDRAAADDPLPGRIRTFLEQRVPAYMIPAQFVLLNELPVSASGKVDKARLRIPAPAPPTVVQGTGTERTVAAVWAEALGVEELGADDDFFEQGGDSLTAVAVVARCRDRLGVPIELRTLFQHSALRAFADAVERLADASRTTGGADERSFREDGRIGALQVRAPRPAATTRTIFLTGATGFVGNFVLRDLLRDPSVRLRCLVRSRDGRSGRERLARELAARGIVLGDELSRVSVVDGHLGAEGFGLHRDELGELVDDVDAVIHNGALVHAGLPYPALRATNVEGTRAAIHLAAAAGVPLAYVSTLSVFDGTNGERSVREDDRPRSALAGPTGYAQSKVVAEWLVRDAIAKGLTGAVFRLAAVTGEVATGICATGDIVTMLVAAAVATRSFPRTQHALELVPVDYVSHAISAVVLRGPTTSSTYHLTAAARTPIEQLGAWIRSFGYALDDVSYAEFRARVREWSDGDGRNHSCAAVAGLLPEEAEGARNVDARATHEALRGLGVSPAVVTATEFHRTLRYLRRVGVLSVATNLEGPSITNSEGRCVFQNGRSSRWSSMWASTARR